MAKKSAKVVEAAPVEETVVSQEAEAAPVEETVVSQEAEAAPVEETVVIQEVTPKPKEVAEKPEPHHVAFFNQYVAFSHNQDTVSGIKALNNCIKTVLASKDTAVFEDLVELFKRERLFLIPQRALQSIASVPSADRAKLEIITVIMRALTENPNTPIKLDVARAILKNDQFVDFIAKKLAAAKR